MLEIINSFYVGIRSRIVRGLSLMSTVSQVQKCHMANCLLFKKKDDFCMTFLVSL